MSVRITLHCNTERRESACATWLMTDAESRDEARAAGRARGWRTTASGDYCPACSGQGPQPATAVVAVIHPTDPGRTPR
ncbi:hypothetical protein CF54_04110 [Streptomyces sp. Tu 6176]|uniref:hypothetical protein n=1 Tax=Streptomyces sp. Tu 6176 TaxID=1470557 RepID=UPI000445772D|nr:hypothetical protein [Streptomyces sp. Tu 6176]EYT83997.1 hypothetical protein CF54_04110 [Streptomyces sp. Tu 6176]